MGKQRKPKACSICGGEYVNDIWPYGNSALPINDGRCCDKCNNEVVVPHRFRLIEASKAAKREGCDVG